jgi:hypothetical protein
MADTDIQQTATTALNSAGLDFSVSAKSLDTAESDEVRWYNSKWNEYLGYYKQIPELKKAIDALAMWAAGKGWTADITTTAILKRLRGWEEDTFSSIIQNMIIVKKVNGDAYSEIIRNDKGTLINLKPLNPQTIVHVCNKQGLIERYEEVTLEGVRKIDKERILHFCNDRVASEIHGTSVIESCKWVIDARNEAMADKRRTMHRSTIRVIEVDMDDTARYAALKRDYLEAIKNGEVLLVPKGNTAFPDVPQLSTAEHSEWIKYLESFFYLAVGVSKSVLGGSEGFTEASSKTNFFSFEQPYKSEASEVEADLWSQLAINVKFDEPKSMVPEMQASEAANTGQTGFQSSELQAGRNV